MRAYEEVAKYYEHRERNYAMALECVHAARAIADSTALATRELRLQSRSERTARQLRLASLSASTHPRPRPRARRKALQLN